MLNIDPSRMEGMDYFAMAKRYRGSPVEFSALTHKFMKQGQGMRIEGWVAAALYNDMRGDKNKALICIEKALSIDNQNIPALQIKGALALTIGKTEMAISSFSECNALRKNLSCYKGLVDSYLSIHQFKEAFETAKEAAKLSRSSPISLTLVGKVYAKSPDGKDRAKKNVSESTKFRSTVFRRRNCIV